MSNTNSNSNHAVQNPTTTGGATTLDQAGIAYISTTLNTYANDGAAATGGIPVGGLYRNGSILMVRVS
jgi:hypothetical protein